MRHQYKEESYGISQEVVDQHSIPIAGAEDYSRVLEEVPGSYVFLGASVDADFEKSEVNHSPRAQFDSAVMYRGSALLSELAVRSLNEMV